MDYRTLALCGLATAVCLLATVGGVLADDKSITSPPTYEIGDAVPGKRIAVMDLKISGDYSEQVRDWLPALIEDQLLKEGWTLVVRGERMQHIQQERNLPGIKPETRLPEQELLGATTFLELTARIQVKDIQGLVGYSIFSFGDFARASVDVNGQVVDPATGVLKSSISVGGSASGLKTALAVKIGEDWRIGAGGYNLRGIRETLVGKAADTAARRLMERLKVIYGPGPAVKSGDKPKFGLQPASTTISADPSASTILISMPDDSGARVGDRYGVYRDDKLIAELEIVKLIGNRAEAKIISQTGPIIPTDKARKMPMTLTVE
jgi:curli biogenesis system outer membrane secretion channel CsgG